MNENSDTHTDSDDLVQPDAKDVVQPEQESRQEKRPGRDHSRRHKEKGEDRRRFRFFWDFRYELLALVLFGLGIFLLLERFKIRTYLANLVKDGLSYLREAAVQILTTATGIEKSDYVGIILLFCAVGLIGFDIRLRMLRRYEEVESEPLCSKCGKQMRRSRSSRLQQALSSAFRVRIQRFSCSKCSHQMSVWRPPHETDW